jgi:hypothetical protein
MGPFGESDFGAEMFKLAIEALQWHWGEAYEITVAGGEWTAVRRDGHGEPLRAAGPERLRELILADYTAAPVPRDADGEGDTL